jgi:hypothetical protein
MVLIADLTSQGYAPPAILKAVNESRKGKYSLSLRTINGELSVIRAEWAAIRVTSLDEFVNRELRLIDFLQVEAIEGWKKSKAERTRKEIENANFNEGARRAGLRERTTTESRDGTADFLITALRCHERRCRLLGLDKPMKSEHSGPDGAPLPIPIAPHLLEIKILSPDEARAVTATSAKTPHNPA